ncbi:uncharacterized protein SPPG_01639 [Spizellomyces punctatus DAOM BR117]|uniref:HMG box domain-containing protein n=1 Tax=Spizellomyces punctatus (strain DAOM BR117) TaxID=645134 RepID=A0A0L0HS72_SPIPD|nr:uncharacterized protein SPPG_01639 [Spizellomyces punctatus DAOM BR117]KND04206.1 hypothetical protein SPPG_01639 [Spizellomyces punctatus DAOM BR117]|eukprot:XP_016612245.1 hypothetical protein SPPG_01639 [Spizellomyces punctatus DAOM BR117]
MPKAKSDKVSSPKKAAAGSKRGASPYNLFMKSELAKVKAETPTIGHKEAFKVAASRWKDAPENPKNKK